MKVLLSAVALVAAQNVLAAEIGCSGQVDTLAYHVSGTAGNVALMVKLTSMNTPVFVCTTDALWSVPGTEYKTSAQACRVLYSSLLAAKSTSATVQLTMDGDAVPSNCSAWASWASANVRYFQAK